MALLVAFVIAGAAIGYYLWVSAGSKTAVVFASRDIAIGHTITRDDLSIVNVSGGVVAVAGGNLSSLLGQHAAVKILADTPVQRAMVTTGSTLSAGEVLVGVAAAAGQVPSSGLAPGDKVQVLQLTQKGSIQPSTGTASTQTVLVPSAVVYDVRPNPTSAGGTLLTVVVPSGGAFGVAQASNSGLIALVRVG